MAEHVDWIAAHREHPSENLDTRTIENVPALVPGFPLRLPAGQIEFRGAPFCLDAGGRTRSR